MTRHVRTPQQERSRQTLANFVEGTLRLLDRKRFDELSVDEIVAATGSSKGAFYHHLRDKQALMRHLNAGVYEDACRRWERLLEPARWRLASLRELVEALVDRTVEIYTRRTNLMRAFAYEAYWGKDRAIRATWRDLDRHIAGLITTLLSDRALTPARELRHPAPERAAVIILAVLDGLLQQAVLYRGATLIGEALDREALRSEAVRALMGYLERSTG